MNCREVDELLGAYALDALSEEEQREVAAHLGSCELHEEAGELRSAVAALAYAADVESPPAEARSRFVEALEAEEEPGPVAPPVRHIPVGAAVPRRLALAPYALAAAFALISLGLLAWNVLLLSGDDDERPRIVLFTGEPATGAIVIEENRATLRLAGLERLGDDRDYQVWLIAGETPLSLGVTEASEDGSLSLDLGGDLPSEGTIAITIEPQGGSPLPTSDPILATEL